VTAVDVTVVAHGVGSRQDLPIPFWAALVGAAVALVVSFLALAFLWREPRLRGADAGRPVPNWLSAAIDSTWFRWLVRIAGLVVTAYVATAALLGPDDALNPTAGVVYVLFWVGTLVVLSVLFGPVWRLVNPLRTLHVLVTHAARVPVDPGPLRYPPLLGMWPAAVALFAFAWLELVAPNRATLGVLDSWFGAYGLVMLIVAFAFGSRWFTYGDGFEAYSSLMGQMSVLGRRSDRWLVWRSPLDGLAAIAPTPGLVGLVAVLLGSTAYDGLSSSPWWIARIQGSTWSPQIVATIGLLGMVALVLGTYSLATAVAGRLGHASRASMPGQFAHSIVPIALGYVIAHYYSLLVIVGQSTIQQLSDPLGRGDDWLHLKGRLVSYGWVSPTTVATVQVVAVVLGHVVGVVLAHDRAVKLFPRRQAVAGQIPLLILMVGYTVGGLSLLFAT
jgi:hypothetical protein